MSLKKIISIIPKKLLLLLFITLSISSLEGIANSAIIGYLPNFSKNSSWVKFANFVSISVFTYILIYMSIWLFSKIQNKIIYLLNTNLKSEYIKKATFKKINTNKEISTLINDFKLIETNYFNLLIQIVSDFCMAAFSTFFVLKLNLLLGTVFIIFAIPQIFIPNIFQPILLRRSAKWSNNNSDFVEKIRDLMGGRDTVLRYCAFAPAFKKIKEQLSVTERSYQKMNNSKIDVQLISWIWSIIALFVPAALGFFLMNTGKPVTISIILSIYLASGQVMQPLREAINDFASIKTTKMIRKTIEQTLASEIDQFDEKFEINTNTSPILKKIYSNDITFSFGNKIILKNAMFTINQNEKILLTGASGIGKSTVFNLLMGSLKPSKGKIIYTTKDGETALDPNDFALIQQDPYIFNDTIRYNLGLGLRFSDQILESCLKEVNLDKELGSKPLDYVCKDGGNNLSGGQRARLEIARALVFDRQIILADEIDANLDPQNAVQIDNLLANIDKTVIMISHHINSQQAQDLGYKQWLLTDGKLKENTSN